LKTSEHQESLPKYFKGEAFTGEGVIGLHVRSAVLFILYLLLLVLLFIYVFIFIIVITANQEPHVIVVIYFL